MLTANGDVPMILTIILVHKISYINPVSPEKKKKTGTNNMAFLVMLPSVFFLTIYLSLCFAKMKIGYIAEKL